LHVFRSILAALAAACLVACPAPAAATAFGQFSGAQTLPVNNRLFGAYLHASDDVVGLAAQLRMSFYPGVDFGFQGVLNRLDYEGGDRSTIGMGADFKAQVATAGSSMPMDIALGGAIGVEPGDDYGLLSVGPTAVASRSFPSGQNSTITPYVGLMLAFSRIDVDPLDDTDISFPVRLGVDFRPMPEMAFTGEIQLRLSDSFNDDTGFSVGVNLPF
jgi:hypothetical protein